jgi:hypothetical protein
MADRKAEAGAIIEAVGEETRGHRELIQVVEQRGFIAEKPGLSHSAGFSWCTCGFD